MTDEILERYRARYKTQDAAAGIIDLFARVFSFAIRPARNKCEAIRRILISNHGQLGDGIMLTSVLAPLKTLYPDCEIGVLVSKEVNMVVNNHPDITNIHLIHTWPSIKDLRSFNLRSISLKLANIGKLVRELNDKNYDIAIDTHSWFPNCTVLLWMTNIPRRIGCDRFGLGSLLTMNISFKYDRRHETVWMQDLIRLGTGQNIAVTEPRPCIPSIEKSVLESVLTRLPNQPYSVLHPTPSRPTKEWQIEKWIELARHLTDQGVVPVITGRGERDAATAAIIRDAVPTAVDLVNGLSWAEFGAVLSEAQHVYSVDTVAGHYARALGAPVVSIIGGMNDYRRFAPIGAIVVTQPLACSPCFVNKGCAHRNCINLTTVKDVLEAAEQSTRVQP